jgi:uncharacterized protein (DUF934 family)
MEKNPMATKLIIDGRTEKDSWHLLDASDGVDVLAELEGKDVIVPLCCWLAEQGPISTRNGKTGVWLDSHELPAALRDDLPRLPLIALCFPVFSDGRAYSSARELRQNMGYTGEIRAIGDVLRDQLFYMQRCGFNAFLLRDDQDLELALSAFADFNQAYQASVDQPIPLFRRRV